MTPRIAYAHLLMSRFAGWDDAIAAQARASQRLGNIVDIYVMSPDREGHEGGVRFVRTRTVPHDAAARWQRRLFKYALFSQLDAFRSYDVVVMRYIPAVDLAPFVLLARARARLVTVHHTKEADEILSAGPAIGPRARAWMERVQSPRILSRVAGIVGVTDEIRDFQLEKVKRPKPAVTVSNGVDVERVSPTGFVPLRASRHALEMIFVASAHLPWHGTDRLLASLAAYRGQRRVRLHLVGSAPGAARPPANDRVEVVYHGVLRGEALDDVFRRATLAVSSLAMFRNGMRQGSPLKTREYVARGIPFVYGYDDADVPGGVPFALQVPNSSALVDMDRIVEFAERVSSRPGTSAEMRSFAMARLDWSVKLAQLRRFAESVA